MAKVLLTLVAAAVLATAAHAQANNKGAPLLIQPGSSTKLTWKTSAPHPDAVMCCGGALQLSWSPMDSGVDHSVVLNIDETCPNTLKNQRYVQYIQEAAPRGLVTLDFNQNGDYFISDAAGNHCSQGMQFLLAVRGCPTDNTIYSPKVPVNVKCAATPSAALGLPGAPGALSAALQQQKADGGKAADKQAAGAGGVRSAAAAVAAVAGAAALLVGL